MLRTAAIQIESRQDQKIFAQVPKSQGKIFLRVGPKGGPSLDPIRIVWAGAIKQSRPAGFATANFYHGTGYTRERSRTWRPAEHASITTRTGTGARLLEGSPSIDQERHAAPGPGNRMPAMCVLSNRIQMIPPATFAAKTVHRMPSTSRTISFDLLAPSEAWRLRSGEEPQPPAWSAHRPGRAR